MPLSFEPGVQNWTPSWLGEETHMHQDCCSLRLCKPYTTQPYHASRTKSAIPYQPSHISQSTFQAYCKATCHACTNTWRTPHCDDELTNAYSLCRHCRQPVHQSSPCCAVCRCVPPMWCTQSRQVCANHATSAAAAAAPQLDAK